jgi:branched-chain amino acid transport system substrate-binding protein
VAEYRSIYNVDPILPNPVMAQDALLMIAAAAEAVGSFDGPKLAEALANLKDIKVASGVLTMDPLNHNPLNKPAVIQKIDSANRAFVFVEKYQGE